jgi:hypothetical protein
MPISTKFQTNLPHIYACCQTITVQNWSQWWKRKTTILIQEIISLRMFFEKKFKHLYCNSFTHTLTVSVKKYIEILNRIIHSLTNIRVRQNLSFCTFWKNTKMSEIQNRFRCVQDSMLNTFSILKKTLLSAF